MMEKRDKNGLTEQEFLSSYNADKYPKPSLTADVAIFRRTGERLALLLIRRGGHPYLGCLALPGGFAERSETLEQSAARELREETGVTGVPLTLLGVFSRPGRDPRGWVVTAAYTAVVDGAAVTAKAADDAADAQWYDVAYQKESDTVTLSRAGEQVSVTRGSESGGEEPALAFDHAEIIAAAVRRVMG